MNKALKVAGLSFALMAAGMGSALAETKIAVVDMGEVFQKLPQREAVSKKLKGEFEPRMRELQKLEADGQKLVEKFKKDEAFMSADQKNKARRSWPSCRWSSTRSVRRLNRTTVAVSPKSVTRS